MNRLSDKQLKNIEDFNKAVKGLATIATKIAPNNDNIDRTKQRVVLYIESNPPDPIQLAGPYLIKYSEQIKDKDSKFFLTGGINEDLNKSAAIKEIFDILSDKWEKLSQSEKESIWTKITTMHSAVVAF